MSITPDDKDWTWVLERPCAECGFDAASVVAASVATMLRDACTTWAVVLTTRDAVRDRPQPDVWSPLEYGCHVRDVFRVYAGRVQRMLDEDGPHYLNWDQDQTAIDDDYGHQDPAAVAIEVAKDGTALAVLFESLKADEWDRTGFRSDGAAFTIDTLSRYFIHDIVHHLHDVGAA